MNIVLKFLMTYWKKVAITMIVSGLVGWATLHYQGLHTEIAELESDSLKLEKRLDDYQRVNGTLNDLIDEQNKRIVAINAARDQMLLELNQAHKRVGDIESEYEQRIQDILDQDTPESCEGAFGWMVDYAMERSNEKSK